MSENRSESGVWFDLQEGKVVTEAPRKGVQLVPPGGEITKDRQDRIDHYREASGDVEQVEQPTEDDVVAEAKPRGRKRA